MTTRTNKSINPVALNSVPKRAENTWIVLAKDTLLDNSSFKIITLPHPAYGKPAKYCLDDIHNKMYEVISFSEPYRSWFIGESVKSDGSLQMMTPFNPVFLVLPRLRDQCRNRAIPLEDLLAEKGFDKIFKFIENLDNVADLKGPAELKAYKYNEEKTLKWLEERVHRVSKVLRAKNIHVTSGSVSATFVTSNINNESIDEELYLKYAFGIISEYLQEELASELEKKFNFKTELIESVGNKRKSETTDSQENSKKVKVTSPDESKDNLFCDISNHKVEVKKQKTLTAKEKARQKAASGTKTISAFFTKK